MQRTHISPSEFAMPTQAEIDAHIARARRMRAEYSAELICAPFRALRRAFGARGGARGGAPAHG
ncbi:hypothetical protein DXV76_09205 [Rhodobacteraceae bacterium CCMM004]|nr:hypothetical protein DXV76_09205 [Rhodobacteraceae bacterium CCMM004]